MKRHDWVENLLRREGAETHLGGEVGPRGERRREIHCLQCHCRHHGYHMYSFFLDLFPYTSVATHFLFVIFYCIGVLATQGQHNRFSCNTNIPALKKAELDKCVEPFAQKRMNEAIGFALKGQGVDDLS